MRSFEKEYADGDCGLMALFLHLEKIALYRTFSEAFKGKSTDWDADPSLEENDGTKNAWVVLV